MAYAIAIPKADEDKNGRKSWDQTAVLTAVKGASFAFSEVRGQMIVDPSGFNRWMNRADGLHSYLVFKKSPEELSDLIERQMMHEPIPRK